MADQPTKTSELPTSNTVGSEDRFVFLYQANTTAPTLRTIEANNVLVTLFASAPTYANNSTAVAGGLPVGAVYQTSTGELRVVV